MNRILLIATGALMNSMSSQQGETIPGIAHAIAIENFKFCKNFYDRFFLKTLFDCNFKDVLL